MQVMRNSRNLWISHQNKVGIRPQKIAASELGDVKFLMMGVTVLKRMARTRPVGVSEGGRVFSRRKREGEI